MQNFSAEVLGFLKGEQNCILYTLQAMVPSEKDVSILDNLSPIEGVQRNLKGKKVNTANTILFHNCSYNIFSREAWLTCCL